MLFQNIKWPLHHHLWFDNSPKKRILAVLVFTATISVEVKRNYIIEQHENGLTPLKVFKTGKHL